MGAGQSQSRGWQQSQLNKRFVSVFSQGGAQFVRELSSNQEFAIVRSDYSSFSCKLPYMVKVVDSFQPQVQHKLRRFILIDLPHKSMQQQFGIRGVKGTRFKQHQLWRIVISVIAALAFLQAKGIQHRRVCLANIFLTGDGLIKLCDPRLYASPRSSPLYTAPQSHKSASTFTDDVFSAGMCLLSLGLMSSLTKLYQLRGEPDMRLIGRQIGKFKDLYSEELGCLVELMLAQSDRPDWRSLRNMVYLEDEMDILQMSKEDIVVADGEGEGEGEGLSIEVVSGSENDKLLPFLLPTTASKLGSAAQFRQQQALPSKVKLNQIRRADQLLSRRYLDKQSFTVIKKIKGMFHDKMRFMPIGKQMASLKSTTYNLDSTRKPIFQDPLLKGRPTHFSYRGQNQSSKRPLHYSSGDNPSQAVRPGALANTSQMLRKSCSQVKFYRPGSLAPSGVKGISLIPVRAKSLITI